MLGFLQGGGPGQGFMLSVLPEHDPALVTHRLRDAPCPLHNVKGVCWQCLSISLSVHGTWSPRGSPGGGVYGATRLKQHSDVFSSSYHVLQSNISVDRNKYTERTPWWKKQALMKRHLALCSWLYRRPAILNLFKRARSKYIFQFVVSAEMKLKNE